MVFVELTPFSRHAHFSISQHNNDDNDKAFSGQMRIFVRMKLRAYFHSDMSMQKQ